MEGNNNSKQYITDFREVMDKVLKSFDEVNLKEIDERNKKLNSLRPLPSGS